MGRNGQGALSELAHKIFPWVLRLRDALLLRRLSPVAFEDALGEPP